MRLLTAEVKRALLRSSAVGRKVDVDQLVGRPLHELFGDITLGYLESLPGLGADTVLRSDVSLTRPDRALVGRGRQINSYDTL